MQNKQCKGIRSKVIANSIYVGDQSLDNDDCHFNGTWLKFFTRVTSNLKATILDLNFNFFRTSYRPKAEMTMLVNRWSVAISYSK